MKRIFNKGTVVPIFSIFQLLVIYRKFIRNGFNLPIKHLLLPRHFTYNTSHLTNSMIISKMNSIVPFLQIRKPKCSERSILFKVNHRVTVLSISGHLSLCMRAIGFCALQVLESLRLQSSKQRTLEVYDYQAIITGKILRRKQI